MLFVVLVPIGRKTLGCNIVKAHPIVNIISAVEMSVETKQNRMTVSPSQHFSVSVVEGKSLFASRLCSNKSPCLIGEIFDLLVFQSTLLPEEKHVGYIAA